MTKAITPPPAPVAEDTRPGPLFAQPWWLEAVAPGAWSEVCHHGGDGRLLGRLPFVTRRQGGLTRLGMPPLSQVIGPWLAPSRAKYAKRLGQEKDILSALIQALPAHDVVELHAPPELTNWLPFHWAGFTQTTRYTYAIETLGDLDAVWGGFLEKIRTDIRKADRVVTIEPDLPAEAMMDTTALTFARQGRPWPHDRAMVRRLVEAATARGQGRCYGARDAQGRLHAAAFIVWDAQSAYYLLGGGDPELRNSGAASLILWRAIQDAAAVTGRFDFEGSMVEGIERHFRAFGGRQVPYFRLTRMNRRARLMITGKALLRDLLGRGGGA